MNLSNPNNSEKNSASWSQRIQEHSVRGESRSAARFTAGHCAANEASRGACENRLRLGLSHDRRRDKALSNIVSSIAWLNQCAVPREGVHVSDDQEQASQNRETADQEKEELAFYQRIHSIGARSLMNTSRSVVADLGG